MRSDNLCLKVVIFLFFKNVKLLKKNYIFTKKKQKLTFLKEKNCEIFSKSFTSLSMLFI